MLPCVICDAMNCSHLDLPDEMFEDQLHLKAKNILLGSAKAAKIDFREESFLDMTNDLAAWFVNVNIEKCWAPGIDWFKALKDWGSRASAGAPLLDLDLTDEEIDEYLKSFKTAYDEFGDEPTHPGMSTGPTSLPGSEPIEVTRKRDGLCIQCGDRGTFVGGACMCQNGHGKIFG